MVLRGVIRSHGAALGAIRLKGVCEVGRQAPWRQGQCLRSRGLVLGLGRHGDCEVDRRASWECAVLFSLMACRWVLYASKEVVNSVGRLHVDSGGAFGLTARR